MSEISSTTSPPPCLQAKNNRPTKEQMSRYKDVLKNILEDNRVTPAEVKDMLAARERYDDPGTGRRFPAVSLALSERSLALCVF